MKHDKSRDAIAAEAALKLFETEIATLQRQVQPTIKALPAIIEIIEKNRGRLIISGLGKSGHVGKKMAATLASTGTASFFIHSTEALHGDAGMVRSGDVVILISNSGSTAEVVRFGQVLKHQNIPVVAITKNADSPLGKLAEVVIELAIDEEGDHLNLAPMSSTTATLVVGDALASAFMAIHNFTKDEFAVFHVGGSLGNALGADSLVEAR